jgi:hypothetical protein
VTVSKLKILGVKTGTGISVALIAVLTLALVSWLIGCARIDKCLDAGGQWDYANDRCEK